MRPAVCIIDDDEQVRGSLRALLESYDFDVETYESPPGFWQGTAADRAGCVLLDLDLGSAGSGIDMLDGLRSQREGGIPVVIITGRGNERLKRRLMDGGVAAYLEKPLDANALLGLVRRFVPGSN